MMVDRRAQRDGGPPRASGRYFATGLVAGLVVSVIVAAALGLGGRWWHLGKRPLVFDVVFERAWGLRAGTPVRVLGIDAGVVRSVHVVEVPEEGWRVAVRAELYDAARWSHVLTEHSVFRPMRAGVLGEMVLDVVPGGQGRPLRDGSVVAGSAPLDATTAVRALAGLAQRLQDLVDGRRPGDPSIRRILRDIEDTVRTLRDVVRKLR